MIAKKFYICLFIVEIVRMISFILACLLYKIGIQQDDIDAIASAITGSINDSKIEMIPKPLFLFMIVPDFLVLIAYLVLFW